MNPEQLLVMATGIFSISAAGFNWEWFFNHSSTSFVSKILGGRLGARIFYFILGVLLLSLGYFYY